jgi:prepilin-type N-terminal cleavage/methylation domain-containing protein
MPSRLRSSSSATVCSPSRPHPGYWSISRPAAGFSLLEVLVALAILGIGLGVIFQGLSQGLRLRGEAAESVRLALTAESILAGLPERSAAPDEPEEGEESGCRWLLESIGDATAKPTATDSTMTELPGSRLVEVRLTLTAPSGRRWELTTLLPQAAEESP